MIHNPRKTPPLVFDPNTLSFLPIVLKLTDREKGKISTLLECTRNDAYYDTLEKVL